jgi:hypothetical protein
MAMSATERGEKAFDWAASYCGYMLGHEKEACGGCSAEILGKK